VESHEPLAAAEFVRPEGTDGSFSRPDGDEKPPGFESYLGPPVTQLDQDAFSAPIPGTAFAPAAGDRLGPRGQLVAPAGAADFAYAGSGTFAPQPGERISPTKPGPGPHWWKADAERDPWRDPDAPFWLAGPPVYLDDEVIGMAEPETEDAAPATGAATGPLRRARFGWSALGLVVIAALIAGGIGGGAGYWLSQRAHRILTDPDLKLTHTEPAISRPAGSVADIARRVSPAVVSIDVRNADEAGSGSGVIINSDGYILTNNHVVAVGKTGTIRVIFSDQSSVPGQIVGTDPVDDMAVIKVDKTGLTAASLGDSDSLVVGDPVVAIGDPLGLRGTVTAGIVSALKRPLSLPGENGQPDAVIDAIQTDAPINPGNSGGALVDGQGAVVGINTAILSLGQSASGSQSGSIGVGFAIPINTARKIAQQLINTGKVVHAVLGLSSRSVTDGSRDGAYVVAVTPGGPADKAGLAAGDVVTLYNQTLIDSGDALTVAVSESSPGQKITLHYVRNGSERSVSLSLG
jgi:S1-C subfamily serine protease